ncbi:MAG: hypothetical protein CO156_04185 [Candidatus Pacebacteria bacterium CG_4_9_14_3_um_filter_40_12]|nr:MAG: hypothetical protein COY01_05860 [Candidatus Pacebacteria bacterium CG_4_10_14_0_2_um_filter_40_20]PJA68678.1 MAG: hypothetical protein CO156_04185 [Candidatus Pacebacteria bacterium CG_4_9_14_3_um_filter_40_12]PJC41618.1 MAG: hypothetical protein CO041_02775 [Candidatus Pacebacteria bacterium CG_4_9_14_0_2_um_filter_40_15]
MFKMLRKQFRKVYSIFSIFLMLFQTVAPAAFLVTPAYAATEVAEVTVSDVTLGFNADSNEFTLAGAASASTEYVLTYNDDKDETPEEAVLGTVDVSDGTFSKTIYAGTCSGSDCVAHEAVSGALKFTATGYQADFTIVDGVLWLTSGAVATVATVETGKTYVAPQNKDVTVTFTTLPETAGSLSIEEITLSDEQVKELGALSNVAYDITSSMENGSFEYELTLPRPENIEVSLEVKHAESVDDLASAEKVETIEVTNKVTAKGLNHFTIFVVVREADIAQNIVDVTNDTSSWFFYNDESDTIDASLGSMVFGKATPPYGLGSAKISVSGTQRRNIATYQFSGTKLADITELGFSTYNPSAGNGGSANRSAFLNFNVTFDGNDTWQKRLVYVPNTNGTVVQNSWQAWNAIDGGNALWTWSGYDDNGAKWPDGNTNRNRTWSDLLSSFSNIAIRTTDSWLGLRVGEPYNSGYTEYIDGFIFGTSVETTIFNFEPDLYQPPSTNDENRDNGWAHVNQLSIAPGETTLDFVSTRNFASCFEYRTDGDVSQATGNPNYNAMVEGLYPFYCINNETEQHTFVADEYVEIRMVFGAEGDERFDWTRFDVGESEAPAVPTGLTIFDNEGNPLGCSGATNNRSILVDWNDNTESDFAYYQYDIKDKDNHKQPTDSFYNNTIRDEDGLYSFRVRGVDVIGNVSEPSSWCNVTLDRSAPTPPTITKPSAEQYFSTTPILNEWSAGSDTGSGVERYQIAYIYDEFHTFGGSTCPGEIIDGKTVSGCRDTSSLSRNHTPALSEQGGVTIWVRAIDNAGNMSNWSSPVHYFYDATNPVVNITSYSEDDVVSGEVTFTGEITELHLSNYNLALYEDGANLWDFSQRKWQANVTNPPAPVGNITNISHTFDTESVPDGYYLLRLAARDKAGNRDPIGNSGTGVSVDVVRVLIDNTAPEITIDSIKYPNGTIEPSKFVTNYNTPVILGSVVSSDTASVVLSVNGHDYTAVINGGVTAWEASITDALPDGEHTMTVVATDAVGNSNSFEQKIFIDTNAPTAEHTYYKDGTAITDSIAYGQTLGQFSFTGEYSDLNPSSNLFWDSFVIFQAQDDHSFRFAANGKQSYCGWRTAPNLVNLSGSTFGLTTPVSFTECTANLTDGEYYMAHHIYDTATRKDIPSINQFRDVLGLHFMIDTVNPSSEITVPLNDFSGDEVETNSFDGHIEGTATDATSGVKELNLEIMYTPFGSSDSTYWNGANWQVGATSVKADGTDTWEYDITGTLDDGIYDVTSHATDNAGNVESTYTIKIIYDKTIPEVLLTIDPTSGDGDNGWYRLFEPTITLKDSDNYEVGHIEYQWNSTAGSWTTYSGPFNPPGEGQNILYYRGIDKLGNVMTDLGRKEVKYDNTKPAGNPLNARVENITADYADGKWEAPSDDSDVRYYKLEWKHEDGTSHGATTNRSTFEHRLDELKDGVWTFSVKAMDDAGNFTEAKVDFRVGPGPAVLGATTETESLVAGTGTGGVLGVQALGSKNADAEETEETKNADEAGAQAEDDGAVLGESTCAPWLYYLPLLMLLLQIIVIVGFEFFRRNPSLIKLLVAAATTVAVIVIFNFLKDMGCYVEGSWLATIAQWFPAIAIAFGIVTKLIAYGFIEEA